MTNGSVSVYYGEGYEKISHYYDEKVTATRVHNLVAIAAGADPEKVYSDEYHTHHKNEIKIDNRPENLQLMRGNDHIKLHLGDYNKKELLEWIDAFVMEFGVIPNSKDLHGWPGPSATTYSNRFGSFPDAIQAYKGWKQNDRKD